MPGPLVWIGGALAGKALLDKFWPTGPHFERDPDAPLEHDDHEALEGARLAFGLGEERRS